MWPFLFGETGIYRPRVESPAWGAPSVGLVPRDDGGRASPRGPVASMKQGQMHTNGRGWCGGCGRRGNRIQGGRRRRKADGWTYTLRLGWVCDLCSSWAKPRPAPPETTGDLRRSPDISVNLPPNVEKAELSTRFGPSTLGDSRTATEASTRVENLPPMARITEIAIYSTAKLRNDRKKARRRAAGSQRRHHADGMRPSEWREFARRRRRL